MGRAGSASASAKTQRKTGRAPAPVPEKNDILLCYLFSIHRITRYVKFRPFFLFCAVCVEESTKICYNANNASAVGGCPSPFAFPYVRHQRAPSFC